MLTGRVQHHRVHTPYGEVVIPSRVDYDRVNRAVRYFFNEHRGVTWIARKIRVDQPTVCDWISTVFSHRELTPIAREALYGF